MILKYYSDACNIQVYKVATFIKQLQCMGKFTFHLFSLSVVLTIVLFFPVEMYPVTLQLDLGNLFQLNNLALSFKVQ